MPSAKDIDTTDPQPAEEDYRRMALIALTHPFAGALGNFAAPEGTEAGILPHILHSGLVQGTAAAGTAAPGLIDKAANALRGIPYIGRILAGPETNSPQEIEAKQLIADVSARRAAEAEGAQQRVVQALGMPEPVTDIDHMISGATRLAGSVAAPLGASKIPGAVGTALGLVLPSAAGWKTTVPISMAIGAGSEAAKSIAGREGAPGNITEAPRTEPVPADSSIQMANMVQPADTSTNRPTSAPPTPMPGAGKPTGPFGAEAAPKPVGQPLTLDLNLPDTSIDTSKIINSPDFSTSQGASNWTVGETWLASAAAAAAGWLALRYGGKGLAAVSDVGRAGIDAGRSVATGQPFKGFQTQADRIAEANAAVAAKPRAMATGQPTPAMPSPLGVNEEASRFRANYIDSMDEAAQIGDAIYTTPAARSKWRAELGTVLNDTSSTNALRYQASSGIEWRTGKRVTPFDDYKRAVAALDEEQTAQWNRGIYAKNELDDRYAYFQQARASKGKIPMNQPADRRGFTGMIDSDLRAFSDVIDDNPALKAAYDLRQAVMRDTMEAMRDAGRITTADFFQTTKAHPNYLASFDEQGRIIHTFGPRDMTRFSHIDEPKFHVTHLDEQHYYAVYKEINENSVWRPFFEHILQKQRDDPAFPKLVTERRLPPDPVTGKPGEAAKPGAAITHKTTYGPGGPKYLEINHPGLARAANTNTTQLGIILNAAAQMRRIYQTGVTGIGAVTGGKGFIPTQLARNMTIIAAQRGEHAWGGQIDRLFKSRAQAGKPILGLKEYPLMFDPTTPAFVVQKMITNTGTAFAKHMADALHPMADNVAVKGLRYLKGDAWVQQWRNTLEHTYRSSPRAFEEAGGLRNIGSKGGLDPVQTLAPGADPVFKGTKRIFTPGDDSVPTLYRSRLGAFRVNTMGLARDVYDGLSDAAHSYYFNLNLKNPMLSREQLIHEVRTVAGDPAVRGASTTSKFLSAAVPFHNVSVQGLDATARAFERAPLQTATGLMVSHSMAALTQLFSAMLVGEWAMNHMANQLSTQQRSGNVIIYHSPGKFSTVSLDPNFAPAYSILLESYGALLGAWQVHQGEPAYDRIVNSLGDMFNHHVSMSTMDSTGKAISAMADVVQIPPPVNLAIESASTFAGHPMRAELHSDQIIKNIMNGRHPLEGFVRGTGSEGNVPDQSHSDNATLNAILTNTIGVAAKAWIDGIEPALHASKIEESGFSGFWSHLVDNYRGMVADQTPAGNILWNNNNALASNTPLADNNQRAMVNIREVAGATGDLRNEGRTSARGQEIVVSQDERKLPTDPTMLRMYQVTANFGKIIAKDFQQIQDYREVMESVRRGPYYANEKRFVMNQKAEAVQQLQERVAAQINQLNQALSHLAGREVDIHQKIDWKGTVSQFPLP